MKNYTYLLLLIVAILLSFHSNAQTIKLKIIETSDVHGSIFPYDLKNDKPSNSSLAQVMTYLKQEKEKNDQHVILLDNGDILQGDPVVYYYNFEKVDTIHLFADAMNYMQYDAATVGNHDIETGHPVYDKFNKEINFPWLAANAVDTKTGKPYFKPYHVIERAGAKIVVLGMITPAIPNWLPEKIWEGMQFDDMIETAKKWVKEIKLREQPDLLIGLFHSGVNFNYNNQDENTYKNENASRLVAEQVKGLDIVFVGHDHEKWNFTVKDPDGKNVNIIGPLAGARTVGVANVSMTYDKICSYWTINSIVGEYVDINKFEPDTDFMNKFSSSLEEVKNYVNRPIGNFNKTISSKDALFGPSEFTDLIHNIQLDLTDADISFTAPLAFNTNIEAGEVFVRDMFNLYRYENLLYTMEISGEEIKNYLEFSASIWFNQMNDENDHLLRFKKDGSGQVIFSGRTQSPELEERYYNFESAAGIKYSVDVSKPVGNRINIKSMSNGNEFDESKIYTVAVNSYRGNGGGGHLTRGAGIPQEELSTRVKTSTEKDLRYYLMKWIEAQKNVEPVSLNNWEVIPQDWWIKGKEKDLKIMFK